MATTQITDVIVPEVYLSYTAVNSPEKTDFFQSGVVIRNPLLDQLANDGGDTVNLPFWKDLDASVEANISSDDPTSSATPNKLTTGKQIARKAFLNQWYSNADIASELAGDSANEQVRNRFGTYWERQWQRRLIASSNGILADNVANDSGDMVHDVASEDGDNATSANLFSRSAFTSAVFTMGDAASDLTAVGVHSAVYKQMVDNDDIDFIPDSQGNMTIPTYMGLRVIVDDGMTVTAGATSGFKYTTVIYGAGAFGYGDGTPEVPMETQREALQGDGGGVEYIGERKTWLLHPFGFQATGTPAGDSFTLAELAAATSWSRVVSRKSVPMAFLVTN